MLSYFFLFVTFDLCVNKRERICLSPYLLSCSHPHTLHCLSYLYRPFICDPRLQQQQSPSNKTGNNSHLWTSKTVKNQIVLLVIFSAVERWPISKPQQKNEPLTCARLEIRPESLHNVEAWLASAASKRANPTTAATLWVTDEGEIGRLPLLQLFWLQETVFPSSNQATYQSVH